MRNNSLGIVLASVLIGAGVIFPPMARSHCDTMDGPVVQAAKIALEKKDVTPVLKWVKKDSEAEIKSAFAKTLAVRTQGAEARALADQFFFETLVRVHRAGEGAPYAGLKPAGTDLTPGIAEADKALETGSVDKLIKLVTQEAAAGIRKRFAEVQETKKHADHNVEAGREFVAAYVDYVHFAEGLHQALQGPSEHHLEAVAKDGPKHEHNH